MRKFSVFQLVVIGWGLLASLYLIYAEYQWRNPRGVFFGVNQALERLTHTGPYRVFAEFDNVGPLKVGDSVRLAGLEVGWVKTIEWTSERSSATVEMLIKKEQVLYSEDIFAIAAFVGSGEYFIKVTSGPENDRISEGSRMFNTESYQDFTALLSKIVYGCREIEDGECFRRVIACVENMDPSTSAGSKR